jgi:hypothetical protein
MGHPAAGKTTLGPPGQAEALLILRAHRGRNETRTAAVRR